MENKPFAPQDRTEPTPPKVACPNCGCDYRTATDLRIWKDGAEPTPRQGLCCDCRHLRPFELTDELFTCPVVNIRIHADSAKIFGCNQFAAQVTYATDAEVQESATRMMTKHRRSLERLADKSGEVAAPARAHQDKKDEKSVSRVDGVPGVGQGDLPRKTSTGDR